jgi:hypothetical protein
MAQIETAIADFNRSAEGFLSEFSALVLEELPPPVAGKLSHLLDAEALDPHIRVLFEARSKIARDGRAFGRLTQEEFETAAKETAHALAQIISAKNVIAFRPIARA